jgi:hypothetical protein
MSIIKLRHITYQRYIMNNYKVEYFLPLILIKNYLQIRNKYTHCIAPYNLALNILSIKLCSILIVNNKEEKKLTKTT